MRVERRGAVALVTLDRAINRNAMAPDLLDGFARAVADVRAQADVRCVVIAGSGGVFSVGADLRGSLQRDTGPTGREAPERSFAMYTAFLDALTLEVPVIGALTGHAVGGGFGLALCCDLRVAQRDAKYGANFVRLGLHPGMAITYLLPRLVGVARANELLLTGQLFSGDEGAGWGLFNRAVAADEVLPAALALAETIAQQAPIAVRWTKRAIYEGLDWNPRAAAWREAFAQAATLQTADFVEGVAAQLGKRPPRFTGR